MESFCRYIKGKCFLKNAFIGSRICSIDGRSLKNRIRVTGVMDITLSLSFNFFLSVFSEVHTAESSGLFIR